MGQETAMQKSWWRAEPLSAFWTVSLPTSLDRWLPTTAADALRDGAWIASRQTALAAYSPIVAAAVGLFAPFFLEVFSESVLLMAMVIAAAILSGAAGLLFWLAYVFGDALKTLPEMSLGSLGGHLVSYLLLALAALRIPQLARQFTQPDYFRGDPFLRIALKAAVYAMSCGALVFVWCQAVIVLIRPFFTWVGRFPTVPAVASVQEHWPWLVVVALVSAMVRSIVEDVVPSNLSTASPVYESTSPPRAIARVILSAIATTLILAGTYENWADAIIAAAMILMIAWLRLKPPNRLVRYLAILNQTPLLPRLVIAGSFGFMVSYLLLQVFLRTDSFRPLMFGALASLILFACLFPPDSEASAHSDPQ